MREPREKLRGKCIIACGNHETVSVAFNLGMVPHWNLSEITTVDQSWIIVGFNSLLASLETKIKVKLISCSGGSVYLYYRKWKVGIVIHYNKVCSVGLTSLSKRGHHKRRISKYNSERSRFHLRLWQQDQRVVSSAWQEKCGQDWNKYVWAKRLSNYSCSVRRNDPKFQKLSVKRNVKFWRQHYVNAKNSSAHISVNTLEFLRPEFFLSVDIYTTKLQTFIRQQQARAWHYITIKLPTIRAG